VVGLLMSVVDAVKDLGVIERFGRFCAFYDGL